MKVLTRLVRITRYASRTKLAGFFNARYSEMMREPGDFILKI